MIIELWLEHGMNPLLGCREKAEKQHSTNPLLGSREIFYKRWKTQ